jgi:hypothetical protein
VRVFEAGHVVVVVILLDVLIVDISFHVALRLACAFGRLHVISLH